MTYQGVPENGVGRSEKLFLILCKWCPASWLLMRSLQDGWMIFNFGKLAALERVGGEKATMPEDEGAANEPITASKHQPFILFTSRVQQMVILIAPPFVLLDQK